MLEFRVKEPHFLTRWLAFVRTCTLVLLPGLPEEARAWVATADEYETLDIFGFDKQFTDAGYMRIAPSTDWNEQA